MRSRDMFQIPSQTLSETYSRSDPRHWDINDCVIYDCRMFFISLQYAVLLLCLLLLTYHTPEHSFCSRSVIVALALLLLCLAPVMLIARSLYDAVFICLDSLLLCCSLLLFTTVVHVSASSWLLFILHSSFFVPCSSIRLIYLFLHT